MTAALISSLLFLIFLEFSIASRERRCGWRCDNDLTWDLSRQHNFCPCVRTSVLGRCVSFDPRIQAITLNDALFAFPNLVSSSPDPQTLYSKPTDEPVEFTAPIPFSNTVPMAAPARTPTWGDMMEVDCTTEECMKCKLKIINGFLKSCPLTNPRCNNTGYYHSLMTEYYHLERSLGGHDDCERLNDHAVAGAATAFSASVKPQNKEGIAIADQIDRLLEQFSPKPKRVKREEFTPNEKLLGMQTDISCPYRRGEKLNADSEWTGLCNVCWKWRKLPDMYFPSYINEASCDSKDAGCLSGWGECRPVMRKLEVVKLKSKDDPIGEPISIEATVACECQVKEGTGLHEWIMRG